METRKVYSIECKRNGGRSWDLKVTSLETLERAKEVLEEVQLLSPGTYRIVEVHIGRKVVEEYPE